MAGHGADDAEWNAHHNDQGLKIAFKGYGQQGKYTEQRQDQALEQCGQAFLDMGLFALEVIGQARIPAHKGGQDLLLHLPDNILGH